jgi:hypothetical protein
MGFVAQATINEGLGIAMKQYKITVKIEGEVINLSAKDKHEALLMAMDAIANDYNEDLAESCDYDVQEVNA